MAVMYLVNATGTLRVSREGELYGLDLHEHGINAYPEYVISAIASTSGMGAHLVEEKPAKVGTTARVALESKA
jgi:Amt family ammonium transporter